MNENEIHEMKGKSISELVSRDPKMVCDEIEMASSDTETSPKRQSEMKLFFLKVLTLFFIGVPVLVAICHHFFLWDFTLISLTTVFGLFGFKKGVDYYLSHVEGTKEQLQLDIPFWFLCTLFSWIFAQLIKGNIWGFYVLALLMAIIGVSLLSMNYIQNHLTPTSSRISYPKFKWLTQRGRSYTI